MRKDDLVRSHGLGFRVHEERYEVALASTSDVAIDAFAVVDYGGERTVVRPLPRGRKAFESRVYRIISFTGDLPLDMVGFLALASGALAESRIPIFVISSYRTDHVLVLEKDLDGAIESLESLGMKQRP
jgi:uncharacterized protein